jgi:MinD superfamily P-loop ATPase
MIITIASGKGGTGKTTFSVNLAYALSQTGQEVRLLDCDVEEPNDHLFVNPTFTQEEPVHVLKPVWEQDKCNGCGKCAAACNYNAIAVVKGKVLIFNELCHSCGACAYVCPEKSISETEVQIGKVQIAPDHSPFLFGHGLLNVGEALAPAVVQQVKTHIKPEAINILDSSPGTACPVVEAVDGSDVAILVTEPTPFGLNDLKLAVGLSLKMRVPTCIIVNRSDGTDRIIADYAAEVGVPIVGRIPFRRDYAETYSKGEILVDVFPELRDNLLDIYARICKLKNSDVPPAPEEEAFPVVAKSAAQPEAGTADNFHEVTVISGKGGTGKTTVVSSLAQMIESKVLADNDVDAADLHLLLTPTTVEGHDFAGGIKAVIDSEKCLSCGDCAAACHFNAIRQAGPVNSKTGSQSFQVNGFACEGCGLCGYVCPVDAIATSPKVTGRSYVSETDFGPMSHAKLGIAEENSGRLVTQVRNRAAELARELKLEHILGDGPPGTGCPVIASVSGADLVLIVTEPTVSGVHDMVRVLELAQYFRIPTRVVVNKADLNAEQADRIAELAEKHGSKVLAQIPFDRNVNDALMAGKTIVDYGKGPAVEAMQTVYNELRQVFA